MKLSVLIKTYNEAAKIAGCLTALFDALAGWGGEAEVIVADSRSTDATVEIAALFPVTVVRLSPQEPRGCGIGEMPVALLLVRIIEVIEQVNAAYCGLAFATGL